MTSPCAAMIIDSAGKRRNRTSSLKLWAMVKCFDVFDVFSGKDTLTCWVSARFPLMKVSLNNNTLWARRFEDEGNVRNAISIKIIIVLLGFSRLVN